MRTGPGKRALRRERQRIEAARETARRTADQADRLRRSRRHTLVIVALTSALAVAVAWGAAAIASASSRSELHWRWGIGGRFSHSIIEHDVATTSAWLFALAVQSIPVVLALCSLGLSWRPQAMVRTSTSVAQWIGVVIAPGLAFSLLVGFATDSAGQSPDDFWPAMAALGPFGLPVIGLFLIGLGVAGWRHLRTKRR